MFNISKKRTGSAVESENLLLWLGLDSAYSYANPKIIVKIHTILKESKSTANLNKNFQFGSR